MIRTIRFNLLWTLPAMVAVSLLALLVSAPTVFAIEQIPDPEPIPGSYGIAATKPKPPPEEGATITIPSNGATFTSSPIDVEGICPNNLLVQVFNNDVMVGSVLCENGSFNLQISLFAGTNDLTAIVYDRLDQAGPTSDTVTVTYNDTNLEAFGELVTLTSSYGRRSAAAGSSLDWPLQLSGGTGPYAFSIDWGDSSDTQLKSQSSAGVVNISHVYENAGIYQVNIRVTDSNGVSAFLQVVAVASGKVDTTASSNTDKDSKTAVKPQVLWIPIIALLVLLLPTYWLGRRSQLVSLRHKMLKDRDNYKDK